MPSRCRFTLLQRASPVWDCVTVDQPGLNRGPAFGVNTLLSTTVGNDAYLGIDWGDLASSRRSPTPRAAYHLYLPRVAKGDGSWSSTFTLQNRNAAITADVVACFYNQSGVPVYSEPATIPAGGALTFNLNDIPGLPTGFYSVVIASDQTVAVANVREYNAILGLSDSYQGVGCERCQHYGWSPQRCSRKVTCKRVFSVFRIRASATTPVDVTYTDGVTSTNSIPPSATYCFNQAAESHASGWAGGATITGRTCSNW